MTSSTPSPTLGAWMKRYRAARDLTQEQLAEQVGCAAQTVRLFEIGRRRPSRELAARMAEVLRVPADERELFLRVARAATPLPAGDAPAPVEPAPAAAAGAPASLPHAPNELIGRQAELEQIVRSLTGGGCRLLTLVGPGGVGKTRLALAAATAPEARFTHGAVWVPLVALRSVDQVVPAIAEALRLVLPRMGDPLAHLTEALRERNALLILDNAEHLLRAETAEEQSMAGLIGALLQAGPGLRLLITSRERLRVPGEWVVELGGLELPGQSGADAERAPAARLFLERARQVDHRFALTPENRRSVAQICRTLEGTPLAIELAASWVNTLTPAEIVADLAQGLDLLSSPDHRQPARHRSLRMVFDHSWALLTGPEQRALAGLAVLRGGGDRAAADAVAGASLPILARLIDKSLIRRVQQPEGAMRYDLHELLRQYADEKLAADPAAEMETRRRHCAHYAALLQAAQPRLQSGEAARALAELAAERGNLQAAWLWAVAQRDLGSLRQMTSGLGLLAELRGWLGDDLDLFKRAVDALQVAELAPSPELRAALGTILSWYGRVRGRFGEAAAACELLQAAATLMADDETSLATTSALGYLAMMLAQRGRLSEGRAAAERNLELVRSRSLPFFVALTSAYLAFITHAQGDIAATCAALAEGQAAAAASGLPRARTLFLCMSAWVENDLGAVDTAEQLAREAVPIAALHRDRWGMAWALFQLGRVMLARADLTEAIYLFNESIELFEETADAWSLSRVQVCLAQAERVRGDYAAARRRLLDTLRRAAPREHITVALDLLLELAELSAAQGDSAAALSMLGTVLAAADAEQFTRARAGALHAALAATCDSGPAADAQAAHVRPLAALIDDLLSAAPAGWFPA